MKWIDKIENGLIVLGGVFGLANIKEIMGIVLLCLQIIIIVAKCIIKVVQAIKLKNINEAIAEIERTQDELEKILPKEMEDHKEEDANGGTKIK